MFDDRHYQRLLQSLEPQQRRFVEEYLKDFNAGAAASRAGYSAKTARQQGSRLLKRKPVKDAIFAGQFVQNDDATISAAAVRDMLVSIAFPGVTDYFDDRGHLLPPGCWPPGAEHAVASIRVRSRDDGAMVVTLRLHNRARALSRVKELVETIEAKPLSDEERLRRMSSAELDRMLLHCFRDFFSKKGYLVIDHEGRTINLDTFEPEDDYPCQSEARHAFPSYRYKDALRPLSPQHRRFVDEYLKDFNAPAAAMRAGYSAKTARHQASRLMKGYSITTALDAGQHLLDDWAKATGSKLQEKLIRIGFASISDYLDDRGRLLPPDRWPPGTGHAVEAITIRTDKKGCTVEMLKLANKVSALSMLYDRLTAIEEKKGTRNEGKARLNEKELLSHLPTVMRDGLRRLGYRLIKIEMIEDDEGPFKKDEAA